MTGRADTSLAAAGGPHGRPVCFAVDTIAALNPKLIKDVNHIEAGWNVRVK